MNREISCELADRWLSRAIDEEISREEERQLESHLDTCPRCREQRVLLQMEVDRIESSFAGFNEELDQLLEGRLGADQIRDAERTGSAAAPPGLRWGAAAAILVMAVIGGFLWWARPAPLEPGRRVLVEWDAAGAEWTRGGVPRRQGGAGTLALTEGDRIALPPGGDAWFTLPDGSAARLGAEGLLVVRRLDESTELELVMGRAAFEARPADGTSFVVLTPLVRAEVTGTRFGVIHEEGRSEVSVEEGEVVVRRRYRETTPFRIPAGAWIEYTRQAVFFHSGGWGEEDGPIPGSPEPPRGEEDPDRSSGRTEAGSEDRESGGDPDEEENQPLDLPPRSGSGGGG